MSSRFLKKIKYEDGNHQQDDVITNYLIKEIEYIVSKKVGDYNFQEHDEYDNNSWNDKSLSQYKQNNYLPNERYSSHINYEFKQEQPFRASRYINENKYSSEFLPFEEEDIRPKIHNQEQIKAMVKKTLRPALNNWLDENLDIIIEKALKKNYNNSLSKPRKRHHYYDEE